MKKLDFYFLSCEDMLEAFSEDRATMYHISNRFVGGKAHATICHWVAGEPSYAEYDGDLYECLDFCNN